MNVWEDGRLVSSLLICCEKVLHLPPCVSHLRAFYCGSRRETIKKERVEGEKVRIEIYDGLEMI